MSSLDQDDELDEQADDDNRDLESPPSGLRAWTARASSYVVSKMVLLEQLSEGVGGYLLQPPVPPERTEFSLDPNDEEGTTSGATSGDDIWGTPTSGGPDDESFTANSVIIFMTTIHDINIQKLRSTVNQAPMLWKILSSDHDLQIYFQMS